VALLETFHAFRGVLVICPCCKEIVHLAELRFQYVGAFEETFLDRLRVEEKKLLQKDYRMRKKEVQFDLQEKALRNAAIEKGRKAADERIYEIEPALKKINFHPRDIKVVAHPIDMIVFDGLSGGGLKNIILVNRCSKRNKKDFCKHLEKVLEEKRYWWETVTIKEDGSVAVKPLHPARSRF
jgi:predicted Holliday junction resolvase-like endonuclease